MQWAEYLGQLDPSNLNSDGLNFQPAATQRFNFQVNLNTDGSFQSFKSATTSARVLNVIRGWASLLSGFGFTSYPANFRGNDRSYVDRTMEVSVRNNLSIRMITKLS